MKVSGGWEGFPAHPRRPLNCLPLNVIPGRIENLRLMVAPLSRPARAGTGTSQPPWLAGGSTVTAALATGTAKPEPATATKEE